MSKSGGRSGREATPRPRSLDALWLCLPQCIEALREQRAQQAARRLASDDWQDSGLVFTTALGTAMDAANVWRDLRRALGLVPGIDPGE
jgi:hypothetical protein